MIQKLTFGIVLGSLLSLQAHAQTSAPTQTATAPTSNTNPVQTIETSAQAPSSAWALKLVSESAIDNAAINEHGSDASLLSLNAVGMAYKFADKSSITLYQYMQYVSNRENAPAALTKYQLDDWEQSYLRLAYSKPTDMKIAGSSGIVFGGSYYAPTDRSQKENQRYGLLRGDISTEWMMTPAWTIGLYLSPRTQLNSSDTPETGSDASYYRMVTYPYLQYNFNDKFNMYYSYYLDTRFGTDAQRGTWRADKGNGGLHEIGVNVTAGSFTFYPCLTSETSLSDASGSILTADARAWSHETISYNFNVSASF